MNLIILVRLADHLTRVHELSGIETKHWLQNSNVVRVYEKEAAPKKQRNIIATRMLRQTRQPISVFLIPVNQSKQL